MMTNAKLVGVYHEDPDPASPAGSADSSGSHPNNKPVKKCLARRQVPLTIEPDLTMIMALDESCLACGSGGGHATSSNVKGTNYTSERDSFLRKYDSLGKDELSAAFMVPFEDLLNLLGTEIPCVGCRSVTTPNYGRYSWWWNKYVLPGFFRHLTFNYRPLF